MEIHITYKAEEQQTWFDKMLENPTSLTRPSYRIKRYSAFKCLNIYTHGKKFSITYVLRGYNLNYNLSNFYLSLIKIFFESMIHSIELLLCENDRYPAMNMADSCHLGFCKFVPMFTKPLIFLAINLFLEV